MRSLIVLTLAAGVTIGSSLYAPAARAGVYVGLAVPAPIVVAPAVAPAPLMVPRVLAGAPPAWGIAEPLWWHPGRAHPVYGWGYRPFAHPYWRDRDGRSWHR